MSDDDSSQNGIRRKNGLEKPWHKLQIATWLLYPLVLAQYFGLLMPLLWTSIAAEAVVTAAFCASSVLAIWACYMTCSIDPIDDALAKTRTNSHPGGLLCICFSCIGLWKSVADPVAVSVEKSDVESRNDFNQNQQESKVNATSDETVYCYICEENVYEHSKHCRYCNKCVQRFDHHCKWLNTCIGEKNYRYFLTVVGGVTVQTTISLVLTCIFLVEAFAYPDAFDRTVSGALTEVPALVLEWLLVVSAAFLLPLVIMVYQLAGFHMTLLWRGMTTYDFIVSEQKKARERDEARRQMRAERSRRRSNSEVRSEKSSDASYIPQTPIPHITTAVPKNVEIELKNELRLPSSS